MRTLKSTVKSMNPRDVVITLSMLILIGLLIAYGAHLVSSFIHGVYDPPDAPPDAVHPLTSLELAIFNALGIPCSDAILCYWLLVAVVIVILAIVWFHVVYLPIRRTVFFIDEVSSSYIVDGDLVEYQPASLKRHKAHPELHRGIYRHPTSPPRNRRIR